ncbi:MFS transporter [Gordonia desulfuricans]|uniref:MFS transporter n=1 Tax=Gordonia desulfuricans TaxID=89051 RepID=A0A7K3LSV0_9ACTN|nr:MFS transporter [Gordonia desulfuricans]NDK91328.1 MFS transporter [Gordonia desulfuricans]
MTRTRDAQSASAGVVDPGDHVSQKPSLLRQPPAVWAVAFASMVAFMGIGLVGPILPTISEDLGATPTQTSLLFTSYLVITAVVMFFTSWLSSRIGTRTTMLLGLAVIVVAAIGCALATDINGIIAFRALWGLGNALFLSTALASIISASGGPAGHAVILYEAALGIGLAVGPLVGGMLGEFSWSVPFWGTATLMAVGFVAIVAIVRSPKPTAEQKAATTHTPISAPFKALRIRPVLILSIVAFFYNASFFVTLAYAPYPLGLSAIGIGMVMTGFGIGIAFMSVVVAPRLTHRFSPLRTLWVALIVFALTMVVTALSTSSLPVLIVCTILLGFEIGLLHTVLTEAVMESSDLPRPVASSAYSGVRFLGGAIGAPVGTSLADYTDGSPFLFAGATALVGALIVIVCQRVIARADQPVHETMVDEAETITVADD